MQNFDFNDFTFLTSDKGSVQTDDYRSISKVMTNMVLQGLTDLGRGYCISTSDMIMSALKHQGIESKMMEVTLTLTLNKFGREDIAFIGFEGVKNPGQLDTHVVVVTQTETPYLIDASISNLLPQDKMVIIEPIKKASNGLVDVEYPEDGLKVSYKLKNTQKVPAVHYSSIIDRIKTDQKIFKDITLLKKLNYIGIFLSMFAVINILLRLFGVV
jgi:hypothetical protein